MALACDVGIKVNPLVINITPIWPAIPVPISQKRSSFDGRTPFKITSGNVTKAETTEK